jgi:hypothetical protein
MFKRTLLLGLPPLALLGLLACGGGSHDAPPPPPSAATTLTYLNPTGVPATSYFLTRNSSLSTDTHLVLDLHGPATTVTGSGVVLTLTLDPSHATWGTLAGTTPVANGSVFLSNLGGEPVVKGRISGGNLQVLVTERGTGSAKPFIGPLLQIALDLKAGQTKGSVILLTPDLSKSKVLLPGSANPTPLPDLRVGALTAE